MSLINSIFLQIVTPVVETESAETLTAIGLLMKGGYLMIPILLLSMLTLYFFVERFLYIKQAAKIDEKVTSLIREKIKQGNLEEARILCDSSNMTITKIYTKGISRLGSPTRDIENALENTANAEINKMEKNISSLSAIAAIAPMIGFLGTVIGMIRSFYNISVTNDISIGVIAGGMYEKMITSASGLFVGIIAFILVTLLNNMINNATEKIENNIIDFLDLLHKPQRA
jgi:biopolymer transport protein ExbB